ISTALDVTFELTTNTITINLFLVLLRPLKHSVNLQLYVQQKYQTRYRRSYHCLCRVPVRGGQHRQWHCPDLAFLGFYFPVFQERVYSLGLSANAQTGLRGHPKMVGQNQKSRRGAHQKTAGLLQLPARDHLFPKEPDPGRKILQKG